MANVRSLDGLASKSMFVIWLIIICYLKKSTCLRRTIEKINIVDVNWTLGFSTFCYMCFKMGVFFLPSGKIYHIILSNFAKQRRGNGSKIKFQHIPMTLSKLFAWFFIWWPIWCVTAYRCCWCGKRTVFM